MESLYRKYRPQTFDDVVGQTHVVTTLKRAVLEGHTSHAYLFCGPRGTGKTTMARLLAKALLCERGAGQLPDGTCEECRLIAAGEHPDVYELDAASNTGVDNVREEIINRVSFAPVRGAYKVYIIDEVHMLTPAAFNALLKTLEEPPAHVVFIMCTTDPQKILETILSRVQRFDFHAISNEELLGRLVYVCDQEGFAYEHRALELIARHARGGMRDALTKLEQLATATGGQVTVEAAQALLGEVSQATLAEVSLALAQRDVPALFAEIATLVEEGRDLLTFVHELAARLRDAYVVSCVGARPGVVDATGDDLQRIVTEAEAFGSPDRLSRALAVLADASTEMRVATNQRLVLELAVTRLARPESDVTMDALAERVAVLERKVAQLEQGAPRLAPDVATVPRAPQRAQVPQGTPTMAPAKPAPSPSGAPGAPRGGRSAQAQDSAPMSGSRPTATAQAQTGDVRRAPAAPAASVPAPQAVASRSAAPASAPAPAPASPAPAPAPQQQAAAPVAPMAGAAPRAVIDPGDLQRRWQRVCDELLAANPARGSLLMQSAIVSDDGAQLLVSLPKGSTFAHRMLERPDVRDLVMPIVSRAFGPRQVSYAEGMPASAPAGRQARTEASPDLGRMAAPQQGASSPRQAPRPAQAQPMSPIAAQAPAPVAPQVPATSAAQPQAPQAAQVQAPGPTPAYPLPWDDDVPPYDDVPYEEMPYEDIDASYYAMEERAGQASATPTPREPEPVAASRSSSPATPASHPAPLTTRPAPSASAAEAAPAEAPTQAPITPVQEAPAQAAHRRTPDLADQASIMALLTDVFGEGVNIRTESAPTAEDVEAAEEELLDAETYEDASEGEYLEEAYDDADYE